MRVFFRLIPFLALLSALSGCQYLARDAAPQEQPAQKIIIAAGYENMASPADIETALAAPHTPYTAASGEACALINVKTAGWIACRDTAGLWHARPSLVRPDALFGVTAP